LVTKFLESIAELIITKLKSAKEAREMVNSLSNEKNQEQLKKVDEQEGFINNNKLYYKGDIRSEENLLHEIKQLKNTMEEDMTIMGDREPEKTFLEKMKDLGFK
jgi:ribosomal protein S8